MDIQVEKSKLIEWLTAVKDKNIIEKLKFFKENLSDIEDWWEIISEAEKMSIDRGIQDIKEGKVLTHAEVMKKYGR
ncbi:MAG: hypothetical protein PSX81_02465 [bacterium]|nr:hypothetical protein [bacterium]